ncbi:hypothetical protein Tco_1198483, partial [Tanacetum coccineum]
MESDRNAKVFQEFQISEAVDLEDVEVQDIRRISKKKASSSTTSSESLSAGEVGLVDVLLIKWENVAMSLFFQ